MLVADRALRPMKAPRIDAPIEMAVCNFCWESLGLLAGDAFLGATFAVVEGLQFGGVLAAQLFHGGVAAFAGGEGEAGAEVAFGFAGGGGGFQRVADEDFGAGAFIKIGAERLAPRGE